MNKIRRQSEPKVVKTVSSAKVSASPSSSASKAALKRAVPQKTINKTKPQTAKSIAPVAKKLATKPSASKKTVMPAAKKASVTPKTTKALNTSAIKANPRIKEKSKPEKPSATAPKLLRKRFKLLDTEYALFKILKQRAMETGRKVKKSELLRAGITALTTMSNSDFMKALARIEPVKVERSSQK